MSRQSRPDLMPRNIVEAFGRLVEELGEVQVECGHILRFGYKVQDRKTGKVYDNGKTLMRELDDLMDAIKFYRRFYHHSGALNEWKAHEIMPHGRFEDDPDNEDN